MLAGRTRVFLFRHGEVDESWRGRVYGSLDIPLSATGKSEAVRAARRFEGVELEAVISSGLERAEYGARCLRGPRALPRIDDVSLREIDRGAWAGMRIEEIEAREPGAWAAWFDSPAARRPQGGESLADLSARVGPRVEHWVRQHRGRAFAIVTHGWVIRVLVTHALGLPLETATRLDIRTGDACGLEVDAAGAVALLGFAIDDVAGTQLSE